jgi:hypothetical protein
MMQFLSPVDIVHKRPFIDLLALVTHYILHNGEWDNSLHLFFGVWTAAFGGLTVAEYVYNPQATTIGAALKVATSVAALYFSILTTSILLYRGFFHRLRKVSKP